MKLKERIKKVPAGVKEKISARIKEFEEFKYKTNDDWFKELAFCILTANFNALKSIKIQNEINNGFLTYSLEELQKKLKEFGHRFPNTRAKYIVEARKFKNIKDILLEVKDKRKWLVDNIKGIGYKEASHFLRNVGFKDYAIIDFHIIDILSENNCIARPRRLTKKKYLEIENFLKDIAKEVNLTLAELDLYLWYLETGQVLK